MSLESELAGLKKDIEYIKTFIEKAENRFEKHIEESAAYRKQVDNLTRLGTTLGDTITNHTMKNIKKFNDVNDQRWRDKKIAIGLHSLTIFLILFKGKFEGALSSDLITHVISNVVKIFVP